jgi:hypothetical protein
VVSKGADQVGHFKKTENSDRQFCRNCGGHVMSFHPGLNLMDVYAATIPSMKFVPGIHVNYAESVLPIRDGLPKMRDFPKEFGGSGELMSE